MWMTNCESRPEICERASEWRDPILEMKRNDVYNSDLLERGAIKVGGKIYVHVGTLMVDRRLRVTVMPTYHWRKNRESVAHRRKYFTLDDENISLQSIMHSVFFSKIINRPLEYIWYYRLVENWLIFFFSFCFRDRNTTGSRNECHVTYVREVNATMSK